MYCSLQNSSGSRSRFGDCEGNNIDPSEVSSTFHVGLSFHLERESIRITEMRISKTMKLALKLICKSFESIY